MIIYTYIQIPMGGPFVIKSCDGSLGLENSNSDSHALFCDCFLFSSLTG